MSKGEQLEELRDEMLEKLSEMEDIFRDNSHIRSRAESYWVAHIKMALSNDSGYLGGSMCSCEDTINELNDDPDND